MVLAADVRFVNLELLFTFLTSSAMLIHSIGSVIYGLPLTAGEMFQVNSGGGGIIIYGRPWGGLPTVHLLTVFFFLFFFFVVF